MFWIWVSLVAEYAISIGLGSAVIYILFGRKRIEIWETLLPSEIALVGIISLAFVGTCLHFITPLSFPVFAWIFLPALLFFGFALRRRWILKHQVLRHAFVAVFLFFIGSLWAIHNGSYYDTGLYNLPVLNWIRHQPIALGIGNLHTRLGFPTIWPIVTSSFYLPKLGLIASFSTDVFIVMMVLLSLVEKYMDHKINRQTRLISIVAFTSALFPFRDALFWRIGSPATDAPVMACSIYCGVLALEWIFSTCRVRRLKARNLCWACATFGATVKLSAAPLICLPLLIEFVEWLRRRRDFAKQVLWLGVGSTLYVLRNVLLSGYLVYPVVFTRLGFLPWAVSAETARTEIRWATAFSRQIGVTDPSLVLGNWRWLPSWWKNVFQITEAATNSLILIVAGSLILTVFWLIKRDKKCHLAISVIMIANLCGITYWFINAPDFRFGAGFFFSLSNLLICQCLLAWPWISRWLIKYSNVVAAIIMFLCICSEGIAGNIRRLDLFATWPEIPLPAAVWKPIQSGQKILVTAPGDQCWDLPLLCTAYYDPNLWLDDSGHWLVFSHRSRTP